MKTLDAPKVKFRKDYTPSEFLIRKVELNFNLQESNTQVTSLLHIEKNPESKASSKQLILSGEQLKLITVAIDGKFVDNSQFVVTDTTLEITMPGDQHKVQIICDIDPKSNKSLEGLYVSNGKFCTQCEAEGFRKITYFLDRPDILAEYFVRIEADQKKYPQLLSNGNLIEKGFLADGRHFVKWHDPFLKPSYLFALVAGNLDLLEDSFTTRSGKTVQLELYVDKGKLSQSAFAMESLKNAMRWDEQRYNLEYDLDLYMIVAVGDFNMGAMENKGLNIFNTKYVLADMATATDVDFENIESVIGHEYFHNWTGNRITCRDWFQLSLKEGLTVFRDQQFTEDMRSKAVKRIDDVKVILSAQFNEDAGPMAHPIRPDQYIEMNNFYTVTVYNKGAEVIRMLHTMLGEAGFQSGMQLYVERHDGQAVTCSDFLQAMVDANPQHNLDGFDAWYSQAGTPTLEISQHYDADNQTVSLHIRQSNQHASSSKPYLIPIKLGLLSDSGKALSFNYNGRHSTETVIKVNELNQKVILRDVSEKPVISLLRDFSAPVKLTTDLSEAELIHLFKYDLNTFNRWSSGQTLMQQYVAERDETLLSDIIAGFTTILNDTNLDNAFKSRALSVPDLKTIFESYSEKGIDNLVENRKSLVEQLANQLKPLWQNTYQELHVVDDQDLTGPAASARALKNLALSYLSRAEKFDDALLIDQFNSSKLMTNEIAALSTAYNAMLNCASDLTERF
ncbi:MAG: aminopeptidase N, partial [Kangiellaceae bacterium]|nr:aminopeptidase N [Kangiellaceae bacterium]